MKKRTVLGLGLGLVGLGAVATSLVAGVKYAKMKKAIRTGQVDGWIKEVTGSLVPYEIKSDIPTPAYIEDDRSKIYFRLSDEDLIQLALTKQSFKTTVQAVAAHEMGHAIDHDLEDIQEIVHQAIRERDYDTYKEMVLERERRAWRLGRQFAPDQAFFDKFNKNNLRAYALRITVEKGAWK